MDREPVALAVFDAMDVLARHQHAARRRQLLPVISSNSVVLPAPFGPSTPTIAGPSTVKSASSVNVGRRQTRPRV